MKGVMDREMIAIDVVDSELKKISRWFLRVNPGTGGDAKIAEIMKRLVKGETSKSRLRELVKDNAAIDFDTIEKITGRRKKAFYGVIFVGLGVFSSENVERLKNLIKDGYKIHSISLSVEKVNKEDQIEGVEIKLVHGKKEKILSVKNDAEFTNFSFHFKQFEDGYEKSVFFMLKIWMHLIKNLRNDLKSESRQIRTMKLA